MTVKRLYSPVQKIIMPNGIKLLIREDHSMPTISLIAYFLGGRRSETHAQSGITALTQHLITKGAGNLDSQTLAEEMEYYGIDILPFYGADTVGLVMKTMSRHFDRAIDLFSMIIMQPQFNEDEFIKERDNLLEDIRKEKDNTLHYCLKMCQEQVFEGHPYGLPPLGTIESISSLTREKIMEYYKKIYSPERMIVSLVGDIEAEEAQSKIEEHIKYFKSSGSPLNPGDIRGPIKNVKEKTENSEKQQVAICVGFHAPAITSEDYFTFQILNQVLSGMGARLFIELRDKQGLAYNVNSMYSGHLNGGIFRAYILTSFVLKERARLALLEEVDRLRTRLVPYDELVRAKRYHLGLFDIELQSKPSLAAKMAYFELMGLGYEFVENYSERIKRITRQKVKRAAEKFLKPQSYAIAILTPASSPKNLQ